MICFKVSMRFGLLSVVSMAAALSARADYTPEFGNSAAYKVSKITETEYKNDTTGMVFKGYQAQADGSLTPYYYRYTLNTDKAYAETVEGKTGSGSGNNENIEVGLALKNTSNTGLNVDNVLYKGNAYTYDYSGDATTYIRGGAVYNSGTLGTVKADFVGNSLSLNSGTIIEGGVHSTTYNYTVGSALDNYGQIGTIEGDFVNNKASGDVIEGGTLNNEHTGQINGIKGDFVGNTSDGYSIKGAVIMNTGDIVSIDGNAVGNRSTVTYYGTSGFLQNNVGTISRITGDFIDNGITGGSTLFAGAIENYGGSINSITGDFINNFVKTDLTTETKTYAYGGALSNYDTFAIQAGEEDKSIGRIEGNFYGNLAQSGYEAAGGAIYNNIAKIGTIDAGYFAQNAVKSSFYSLGGAIYNNKGIIEDVYGDFVGNSADGSVAQGGAIYQDNKGKIGSVTGDFNKNKVVGSYLAVGGAISNEASSEITSLDGNFTGNEADGGAAAYGGAIYNDGGKISTVKSDFSDNKVIASQDGSESMGGAVYNYDGDLPFISGNFSNNQATATGEGSVAMGGAVYSYNSLETSELNVVNSNFYNNKVVSENGEAQGGAIYANRVSIIADGENSEFRGNTANGKSNAIYMGERDKGVGATSPFELNLNALNGGNIIFDDVIDGDEGYDLNLTSGENSEIVFNNLVNNVKDFNLATNTSFHLGKDAVVNVQNYIANGNNTLTLDMALTNGTTIENGLINVSGDVQGDTGVVIKPVNNGELDHPYGQSSVFVKALNDDLDTDSSFNVIRYDGSPYEWEAIRNYKGETDGSTWYLALKGVDPEKPDEPDDPEPNPDNNLVYPEVVAYTAVQTAAVEQNRNISQSVGEGIQANLYKGCCQRRDKRRVYRNNLWINADYSSAEIDAPAHMDADIKGITAGIDMAGNLYHRFGVFGSYRQGEYDLSGKGKLNSSTGSELDIDSYLGGLYYRYGRQRWVILATVFGGTQDIDLKTDDKIISTSTDALQYGASLEVARKFYFPHAWIVEPSLGVYYTAVDMDPIHDEHAKSAEFDVMHYMEAELGLRIEKAFCMNGNTSEIYVKPSIIRTFTSGGDVKITELGSRSAADDQTLGKIAVGAHFGLTRALSAYTSVNYVFGSDYKSYGVDAGLTYSW